ncbi:MAG: phage terminase large subunit [Thermoguttaceae bacterium]|nr:phage terminase large subunit [Thermoguttaceae bacterium]
MRSLLLRDIARRTILASHKPATPEEIAADAGDLVGWVGYFLPNYAALPPSRAHRWFAETVAREAPKRGFKLNFLAPRGAAKSTFGALAYPLREALAGRERYIWIISDVKDQAKRHLENIVAELESNPRLRAYYFDRLRISWRCEGTRIVFSNGAVIEAFGTGQKLRGRRERSHRPTLIVCDDLQNDSHIASKRLRETSRRWFFGAVLKAGDVGTNFVHLSTALHPEALGWELKSNPGWTSRVFPALIREPDDGELWSEWKRLYLEESDETKKREGLAEDFYRRHLNDMNRGAETLWPEKESLLDLMKMRVENGEAAFQREKQNRPTPTERAEFPEEYFEGIFVDSPPPNICASALALDPGKGRDARAGDYSAFVFIAADAEDIFYVDAVLERLPISELGNRAVELQRRFRPDVFAVESNQFQELLRDEIERKFIENNIFDANVFPIENRVGKATRIRRLEPILARRRMRFARNSPGVGLLVDQLKLFPVGDHDDGPDALEMALRALESARVGGPIDRFSRAVFG